MTRIRLCNWALRWNLLSFNDSVQSIQGMASRCKFVAVNMNYNSSNECEAKFAAEGHRSKLFFTLSRSIVLRTSAKKFVYSWTDRKQSLQVAICDSEVGWPTRFASQLASEWVFLRNPGQPLVDSGQGSDGCRVMFYRLRWVWK